ncbi:MAG: ACP S-malonyltransferase, partial [Candidatus Caldatribacterium sp.]|nr:ACP S-malonyltransferase [Candidatus Caldatribacterium sp.]
MKVAFLFPGQGSQKVGMLREWMEEDPQGVREVFERASSICGEDLLRLALEGPEEELNLTKNSQPIILTMSAFIAKKIPFSPDVVAGHSLGEYSALLYAGSFTFDEAVYLVRKRGEIMQEASPLGEGTMVAVVGLPLPLVESMVLSLRREGRVEIANVNSSDQVVLSLERVLLPRVLEEVKHLGGKKALELRVSAPFHSSFMEKARESFAQVLDGITIRKPRYLYVSNVTASFVSDPEEIRSLLLQQLTATVRWKDIMDLLVQEGVKKVLEVGPGMVLTKLFEREYLSLIHISEPT